MDYIEKAKKLINNKKFTEAEEILNKIEPDKMPPEAKGLLGKCFYVKGFYSLAQDYIIASLLDDYNEGFAKDLEEILTETNNEEGLLGLKIMMLEHNPDDIYILREITKLAQKNKIYDIATEYFLQLLKLCPKDYIALNNLGLVYEAQKDFEKAQECYQKALKIFNLFDANFNLGVLCRKIHKFENSVKYLTEAQKLKPDYPNVKYSLAMSMLMMKDFLNGYRLFTKHISETMSKFYKNEWKGGKHTDSSICVFATGGFGDMIMFSRYLEYLPDYFKTVYVYLPKTLHKLFERNFPYITIIDSENEPPQYDYATTLFHLMKVLNMDFNDDVPKTRKYLSDDKSLTKKFKFDLFVTDKLKIGINWHGTQKGQRTFTNRSMPIEQLEPIFEQFKDNAIFYSIQKDEAHVDCQKYPFIVDLYDEISDFDDTASLLCNFDLLITIDSAPVHLAGALGVKTCLLLPYANEWRWFDKSNKSIWYNSVEIFRQEEEGVWSAPIEKLSDHLCYEY